MNRILLASHGPLAKGMKDTLAILAGENDRIETLCAYVDDQSRDVAKMIDAWEAGLDPDDRWIVVTDVFGGSVNNEFLRFGCIQIGIPGGEHHDRTDTR